MTKRLLPLILGGLVVEQVLPEPDRVTVVARSRLPTVACPDCRAFSSRVHSRYERHLADLPWQGRARGHPAPGAAVPLPRARLPAADLRRAAARHRPPLRPALRAS